MKNIQIDFELISLDTKTQFNVNGEINDEEITFTDNEKNKHFIKLSGSVIQYLKVGLSYMKFLFDLENMTTGFFSVDNNEFLFNIKTTKLINEANKLEIEYELFQEDELINKNKLILKYNNMKEE